MCTTQLYLKNNTLLNLFQKKTKKIRRSLIFFVFFWNTVGTKMFFEDFYKKNSDLDISDGMNRVRNRKNFFKKLFLLSRSQNLLFFFFFQNLRFQNHDFRIQIQESRFQIFRFSENLRIWDFEIARYAIAMYSAWLPTVISS